MNRRAAEVGSQWKKQLTTLIKIFLKFLQLLMQKEVTLVTLVKCMLMHFSKPPAFFAIFAACKNACLSAVQYLLASPSQIADLSRVERVETLSREIEIETVISDSAVCACIIAYIYNLIHFYTYVNIFI